MALVQHSPVLPPIDILWLACAELRDIKFRLAQNLSAPSFSACNMKVRISP
jgi:hypothetical protein